MQVYPKSTSQVSLYIGQPQFRLDVLVRNRRVCPPLICGRYAWSVEHILQAAKILCPVDLNLHARIVSESQSDGAAVVQQ